MNGELINPQNFILFPYDWFFVLVIIFGVLARSGFQIVKGVGKTTLIVLIVVCVCLFVFDLRALFSDQQQYNAVMEAIISLLKAILPLLTLVTVAWVMWLFFIKKPKP